MQMTGSDVDDAVKEMCLWIVHFFGIILSIGAPFPCAFVYAAFLFYRHKKNKQRRLRNTPTSHLTDDWRKP